MLEPNPLVNLPDLEQVEWNYDQSVQKMRKLVVNWRNLSLELLRELCLARMNLSDRASRDQIGWMQYLLDVGITRTTAHRWLSKYDFDNDELIRDEEIRLPKEVAIVDQQRHPEDFYPTHPTITQMLLDREELDGTIWEPACGQGDMSKVLIGRGYDVLSTDLIDRGYGEGGIDFLDDDQISRFGQFDNIITNPPFTFALDFVLQAKKIARKKICILNSPMFLDGIKRYEMWIDKDFPLKNMYQFAGRVVFRKDGLSDQSQNGLIRFPRAWFVFEKGYTGKPTIDWILPELDDEN